MLLLLLMPVMMMGMMLRDVHLQLVESGRVPLDSVHHASLVVLDWCGPLQLENCPSDKR